MEIKNTEKNYQADAVSSQSDGLSPMTIGSGIDQLMYPANLFAHTLNFDVIFILRITGKYLDNYKNK